MRSMAIRTTRYGRYLHILLCASGLLCAIAAAGPAAAFTAFSGGAAEEALWRTAAGPTALEDFESYANGTQIPALGSLHLTFDELAGGGYPQAYLFGDNTPYGATQLGNFPNGVNEINRWNDVIVRPAAGFDLRSMGFWNGDGQQDTLVAFAYDGSGALLGTAGAFSGGFAGFVSDVPIGWVRFDGNTGDGWNHLDGLQVNSVPEPATLSLTLLGVAILARSGRRSPDRAPVRSLR